jgi:CRP-like cAMP-binding protein
MDLLELLKMVELFNGLGDEQLHKLAAISKEETFQDGALIFSQGEAGESMYIVRQGQVEITVRNKDAVRSQIYLGDGQIFGEMALIDYGLRSATVHAVQSPTIVDQIRRDDFFALCESDKALGFTVMHNIAVDLSFKLRHRNLDPNAF